MQTTLPESYRKYGTVNLSEQKRLMLLLSVASIVFLFLFGWMFWGMITWLRPELTTLHVPFVYTESGDGFSFQFGAAYVIGLIIAPLLVITLHEGVHGLLFWMFTRRRPLFGFKIWYAYAAAPPGVYVPRNPYLVVALAPLIVLSLLGLLLVPLLPLVAVPTLFFFLTLNASGAVGDMFVSLWLLRFPSATLIEDVGATMTAYGPA